MLIIEDDPYYFLQFEKVQTALYVFVTKERVNYSCFFLVLISRGLQRSCPWMLTGGSSGRTPSLRSCLQGERVSRVCVSSPLTRAPQQLWTHL